MEERDVLSGNKKKTKLPLKWAFLCTSSLKNFYVTVVWKDFDLLCGQNTCKRIQESWIFFLNLNGNIKNVLIYSSEHKAVAKKSRKRHLGSSLVPRLFTKKNGIKTYFSANQWQSRHCGLEKLFANTTPPFWWQSLHFIGVAPVKIEHLYTCKFPSCLCSFSWST